MIYIELGWSRFDSLSQILHFYGITFPLGIYQTTAAALRNGWTANGLDFHKELLSRWEGFSMICLNRV